MLEETAVALEETAAGLLAEVNQVLQTTTETKQAIRELYELEEERRQSAGRLILDVGANVVRHDLKESFSSLKATYEARTAARQALRDAKDAFAVAEANATVEVKTSGELVEKDPATGKSNKDWIEGQVATMLEVHPDYQKAKKALRSAENRVFEADMNLDLAQSRLSVVRNEARLVAAMLGVGGNSG